MWKFINNNSIVSGIIATLVSSAIFFLISQYRDYKSPDEIFFSRIAELQVRALTSESLLRVECIKPVDRISDAYNHIFSPATSGKFKPQQFDAWDSMGLYRIRYNPEFTETSSVELVDDLLSLSMNGHNWRFLDTYLDKDFLRELRSDLVNIRNQYSPEIIQLRAQNIKLSDRSRITENIAESMQASVISAFSFLFERYDPKYKNKKYHLAYAELAKAKGRLIGGDPEVILYHESLRSFDKYNEGYWWKACSKKMSYCYQILSANAIENKDSKNGEEFYDSDGNIDFSFVVYDTITRISGIEKTLYDSDGNINYIFLVLDMIARLGIEADSAELRRHFWEGSSEYNRHPKNDNHKMNNRFKVNNCINFIKKTLPEM